MKKVIIPFLSLMLCVALFSCSSDDETANVNVPESSSERLEASLDSLNHSILAKLDSTVTRAACSCSKCTSGCKCGCKGGGKTQQTKDTTTYVLVQDGLGALYGAAAGATIGGNAGTVTLPLVGTISGGLLGAIVGSIVGAAGNSWIAAHNYVVTSETLRDTLAVVCYDNVMGALNLAISTASIHDEDYIVPTFANELSQENQKILQIAGLHNGSLRQINDTVASLRSQKYISYITKELIDSIGSRYVNFMTENRSDLNMMKVPSASDYGALATIATSFFNMLETNGTSKNNVQIIISDYMNYAEASLDLTKTEKYNLRLAIGVCWHSYRYWK